MKLRKNSRIVFFAVSLMVFVFLLAGCGWGNDDDTLKKLDVIDSKIDYFVFRNKKIYLIDDLEQYIMQFQGFKCKLNSNMALDNIESEEHAFYQEDRPDFGITCPNLEIGTTADFYVYASHIYDGGMPLSLKSVEREITDWRISGGSDEGIKIYFGRKYIEVNGENASKKDDVIDIMGSDYELEKSITSRGYYDIIYDDDNVEYKFAFDDDDELFSVWIEV